MENYTFDLQRIFIGATPPIFLLEVMLRTTFLFIYTLAVLRLIGARAAGQLSLFELVIVVALGSAVGDPMFYADVPLIYGIMVITIIVILQRIVLIVTNRHRKLEQLLEGHTHRIVVDGQIDENGLAHTTISKQEVMMELRQKGVEFLEQVRCAYLESDGHVSVFLISNAQQWAGQHTSIMPEDLAERRAHQP